MIPDLITGDLVGTVTVTTALGAALVAGIFYAFSTFVMQALARLPAEAGIAAMQAINETVINPWFFAAFFGTALGALILAATALLNWSAAGTGALLFGALLYLIGTILVTMLFSVPLNNSLANVKAADVDGVEAWQDYLDDWTRWNHLRTASALGAAVTFFLSL